MCSAEKSNLQAWNKRMKEKCGNRFSYVRVDSRNLDLAMIERESCI